LLPVLDRANFGVLQGHKPLRQVSGETTRREPDNQVMGRVTIQLIEGLERGRVLFGLETPVTIGREDGNTIRLNDERVSRFHAKIQEDAGRYILTDLDSTNGSRVNGHPVQLHVLRTGDHIAIGRCLLIFGSNDEIASVADDLRTSVLGLDNLDDGTLSARQPRSEDADSGIGQEEFLEGEEPVEDLFPAGPPHLPTGLGPAQRAAVSDQLAYVHERLMCLIRQARADSGSSDTDQQHSMMVDWTTWQQILHLEMHLAATLRKIAEPSE
jgi:pSer/pThr/pTyr-binding forkhead associated (FHA) protein